MLFFDLKLRRLPSKRRRKQSCDDNRLFPPLLSFSSLSPHLSDNTSVNGFSQSLIICFWRGRAPNWWLYLTSPLLSRSILRRCVLYFSRTTASARTAFSMMPRYLSASCLSWTVSSADGFGVHLVVNRSLICVSWRSSSSITLVACQKQKVFNLIWVIDQACSVNKAGYWSFLMHFNPFSVHKNAKKMNEPNIQSPWQNKLGQ